jgi:dTDP-4-amino-4,6-dideoxygalactose transaminase
VNTPAAGPAGTLVDPTRRDTRVENPARIFLSPPDMSDVERSRLLAAFDSNWIAPVGPDLEPFEEAVARWCGRDHAVALSSGTAALHLALVTAGVGPGDTVIVPSLTFVATANAVLMTGARPVFVDSEAASWNADPSLIEECLRSPLASGGAVPAAVVAVDLYGQCADYGQIEPVCRRYGVPLIVDAAESLGAIRDDRPAGSHGDVSVVSFNGNKIATTGGGGALLTDDAALAARVRHLATQAREPFPHYEHIDAGFNYRMSNLAAAIGRAQLERLDEMLRHRRHIGLRYRAALAGIDGVSFMPVAVGSVPNGWLTVMMVDPAVADIDAESLRAALDDEGIESRPAWKPMHDQPLFADAPMVGGEVAERVFAQGLCLPSGSSLRPEQLDRVIDAIERRLRP